MLSDQCGSTRIEQARALAIVRPRSGPVAALPLPRETMGVRMADQHTVVSHDQWLDARKALLAKEKEFTRLREELSQQRRELPWEAVAKNYLFEGPDGNQS